ncbi:MAG: hypothetical protein LQ349_009145 [Xanthoria aureola]|nr:MAG: hypothetical protein LQ349_009145 [Xanthoria aureola]
MMSEPEAAPTPSSAQPSTKSYFSYPVSHVVSGLYRRLTEPDRVPSSKAPPPPSLDVHDGVYTPPQRTASPFQPPPLTPLTLKTGSASSSSVILTRALAEEIRLLVPPRLQLAESWSLAYSLEEDGVSLTTLYNKCASRSIPKSSSFILVIKDAAGGVFGAYLTDPPRPFPSFYGTGECFLWRSSILPASSILSFLPPPPSAPESATLDFRSTTIASPTSASSSSSHPHHHHHRKPPPSHDLLSLHQPASASSTSPPPQPHNTTNGSMRTQSPAPSDGISTPASSSSLPLQQEQRIRFKAFPYSGVNDYLIFCEQGFLSVGGGDGKYGLWLDRVLERGISSPCMTFGNEGLSEEGEKFEVVGVEVWWVGS